MHRIQPKRKSQQRFQQLNRIVDDIAPTLPSASHVAVLLCCYRHARTGGAFQVSTKRIAEACRLSHRQVRRVIDDMETGGVIEMTKEHEGPIPRRYRITGQVLNGDTHVPISNKPAPQVNGDTHDR